ncbi:hypothetical protein AVEN_227154-1 [Araneus ventricosus]|uniref:Uncharacterized protein n=1 Tax=Araneus ventricosus TaxID=182803 RepID=A0A4Y2BVY9_ARAVE|nr:hypothetical protein AVEN_227154-1 [Araneus ventricosus]
MTRTTPELVLPSQSFRTTPSFWTCGLSCSAWHMTDWVSLNWTPSNARLSLVILTPPFEATRGLFWDGPRNFEQLSDGEDDIRAGAPSPSFRATSAGGRLATAYDLACSGPHTRWIFSGMGFRTWNPSVP